MIAVGPDWSRPLVVPVRRVRGVYDFVAASSAAASAARTGAKYGCAIASLAVKRSYKHVRHLPYLVR